MERISGPYNGFYIATRAARTRDSSSGYLALAKICRGRPESFRDAFCCATVDASRAYETEHEAIADAENRALVQTSELAPFGFAKPAQIRSYARAA